MAYDRDAYMQNEIVLLSLKCAVEHLQLGGTFVTKVYRSPQYTSLTWVLKQLFGKVDAVKPQSSRQASAEIFLVCSDFKAPAKVDPRFFSPKDVFEDNLEVAQKKPSVFSADYGKKVRSRQGYGADLGLTLRKVKTALEFVESADPIDMLSDVNAIVSGGPGGDDEGGGGAWGRAGDDVREMFADLRVLGKAEFKALLKWREAVRVEMGLEEAADAGGAGRKGGGRKPRDRTREERERDVDEDVERAIKEKRGREKRERKKERERKERIRRRKVAGLEGEGLVEEEDGVFDLGKGKKGMHDVRLDDYSASVLEDAEEEGPEQDDLDIEHDMDEELERAYGSYLAKTKDTEARKKSASEKRRKKEERARLKGLEGDDEGAMGGEDDDDERKRYLQMLEKGAIAKGDSDGSDTDDDDEDEDEDDGRGRVVDVEMEGDERKARSFFADDFFDGEGDDDDGDGDGDENARNEGYSSSDDSGSDSDSRPAKMAKISADDILATLPKTDKQRRHEARVKAKSRMDRRDSRRAKERGEEEMQVVPQEEAEGEVDGLDGLDEKAKKRVKEARRLIAAGMGKKGSDGPSKLEIAPRLPVIDDRKYGSDEEDYDSDDLAETLAAGTVMLRPSKAKQFVDASYNRYAWNDPKGLPDWFQDDERRHYKPNLPLPPELVQKMKERFMTLAAKPIAKVAEARARKSKRANTAIKAARKKAEAVAGSADMTEAQKLKAISSAMKAGQKEGYRQSKQYVVARKGASNQGGKGIKLVDRRLKSDKRGTKRAASGKSKRGKVGGRARKR